MYLSLPFSWPCYFSCRCILNISRNTSVKYDVNVCSVDCFWIPRTSSSVRWRKHTRSCWRHWLDSILSRRHTKTIAAGYRSIAAAVAMRHISKTGSSHHRSYSIAMIAFLPDLPTLGFVISINLVAFSQKNSNKKAGYCQQNVRQR